MMILAVLEKVNVKKIHHHRHLLTGYLVKLSDGECCWCLVNCALDRVARFFFFVFFFFLFLECTTDARA